MNGRPIGDKGLKLGRVLPTAVVGEPKGVKV